MNKKKINKKIFFLKYILKNIYINKNKRKLYIYKITTNEYLFYKYHKKKKKELKKKKNFFIILHKKKKK
jgi:hypothetical protein